MDLATQFSNPEEKLWIVVKGNQGGLYNTSNPNSSVADDNPNSLRKGIKLEKNSVIKLGRVRLRVRDIDYPDQEKAL